MSEFKCTITGNKCLTDAWDLNNPPDCHCGNLLRKIEEPLLFQLQAKEKELAEANSQIEILNSMRECWESAVNEHKQQADRIKVLEEENRVLLVIYNLANEFMADLGREGEIEVDAHSNFANKWMNALYDCDQGCPGKIQPKALEDK